MTEDEMVRWHHRLDGVWVNSGSWWWTGRPGMLQSLRLKSWTRLSDWTELGSCVWLCNPMDCSSSAFHVLHYIPEFSETHIHWVGDAIQPFHPLSPSSASFNYTQNQGLFQMNGLFASDGQNIGASATASGLPMNIQNWFLLGWTGWISLQSKGLSRVFSNTTVQKHQFFGAQLSLFSNSHIHTWLLEKP